MDSPFQQYLRTNYVPTVDEAKQVQDLLEISGQKLRCIDTEIDQLKRQLDMLQEKRLGIHVFAEQHRALLSPARKLTQDIVEEIFIACLPEDRNPHMNVMEAPMILTQICSSWRRIALSTPRIWSAIHIVLPNIIRGTYPVPNYLLMEEEFVLQTLDRRQAFVKKWLDRSGACPLSISIHQTPDAGALSSLNSAETEAYYNTKQKIQQIHRQFFHDTIIPYHQRWYNLDISFSMDTLRGLLEIGLKTEYLKMLKELHINRQVLHSSELSTCEWKEIVAFLSLNVTTVTFYNIPTQSSDIYSVPLHAGWGRLTDLNLYLNQDPFFNTNLAHFAFAIICRCKSLKTLKLGISFIGPYDNPISESGDNITLHHPTALSLSVPATNGILDFLKRLYLPSIKELNIQLSQSFYLYNGFEIAEEIIKSLLRIHGGCLSLGLYAPNWLNSTDNLVQLLKFMPYLKYLKISSKNINNKLQQSGPQSDPTRFQNIINDDLLYTLTPVEKEYSDIICPQLEELECDTNILTGITESSLKDFVRARKGDERIASLSRLSLFINDFKRKEDPTQEKLTLGTDSAIFFRKPGCVFNSDLRSFEEQPFPGYILPTEVFTII
ncbi:hypothetical protein BDQ17DRAFT_1290478 [Cyathus striatus]|nr:hypothetical protein BDQ17DRAFT_1290478 [Cyathus striatus]